MSDLEHLFVSLMTIFVPCPVSYVFRSFAQFSVVLLQFLTVLYMYVVLVLNLYCILQLSFPSFSCHLTLFVVVYSVVLFLKSFLYSDLFIFPFIRSYF